MAPGRFNLQILIRDALIMEMKDELAKMMELGAPAAPRAQTEIWKGNWKKYMDVHEDLLGKCPTAEEVPKLLAVHRDASEVYTKIMSIFEQHRQPIPSTGDIKLQKFSGDWSSWAGWRAVFEDRVLKTEIAVPQKIDLLLDALEGEAKEAAGRSESRDKDELDRIWGKLVETYDNPYQQVYAHIFDMISLPNIETASPHAYRGLVNRIEENMRLLQRYRVTSDWNAILCVMAIQKLDQGGRYLWNTSFERSALPDINSLFKFLNVRSRALEDELRSNVKEAVPSNSTRERVGNESNTIYKVDSARPSFRKTDYKPYQRSIRCGFCKDSYHLIFVCQKFINLSPKQRSDFIVSNRFCRKCLGMYHDQSVCRGQRKCDHCSSFQHHTMLCIEGNGQSGRQLN